MSQEKKAPAIFVVEHLDPELGPWSALEYQCIAQESSAAGVRFMLTSVPVSLQLPNNLKSLKSVEVEHRSVEEIFANKTDRICLLDPAAPSELCPEDGETFEVFLFGGILGDHPPRDRTSELRKKGYTGRRLGPVQMTTDTAVRVTRLVTQDRVPLEEIPYIDNPELRWNKHESTQLPFRYVKGKDGKPTMPEGMVDLIREDADRSLDDLL
ncbi:hypothetical protein VTO42DRAFT_909 [Malbranchea cinnamomea]